MKEILDIKLQKITLKVPPESNRKRLDQFLAQETKISRTAIQELIKNNFVKINNIVASKASLVIKAGDKIHMDIPEKKPEKLKLTNELLQTMGIEVIFEGEHFLVVSKPAGVIVHQAENLKDTVTLADWIIFYYKEISKVGDEKRPGIVHRLDKNTSGLLLIARTQYGYKKLIEMFKNREIKKSYLALVQGHPEKSGTIDFNIVRHLTIPTKMTHQIGGGREAVTNYVVKKYFKDCALLELTPVTGRTHQIRVHCAAIGHPILGDTIYGIKSNLIKRQALHAQTLSFEFDGEQYKFSKEPPQDFSNAIKKLEKI